jgi:hypothetical protein
MPLITERVKDIVGKAKLGLFQAHAEDLRLKWIILEDIGVASCISAFSSFSGEPQWRKKQNPVLFRVTGFRCFFHGILWLRGCSLDR